MPCLVFGIGPHTLSVHLRLLYLNHGDTLFDVSVDLSESRELESPVPDFGRQVGRASQWRGVQQRLTHEVHHAMALLNLYGPSHGERYLRHLPAERHQTAAAQRERRLRQPGLDDLRESG